MIININNDNNQVQETRRLMSPLCAALESSKFAWKILPAIVQVDLETLHVFRLRDIVRKKIPDVHDAMIEWISLNSANSILKFVFV